MKTHVLGGIAALLLAGSLQAEERPHHEGAPLPIATPILSEPLSGHPGKEVLLLSVEFPPDAVDPVHRHDAQAFVYVLEGSIVMGVAGGQEVVLGPGQTFQERPEDLHTIGRNASTSQPARFLAFLIKDVGKPAVIPVDQ